MDDPKLPVDYFETDVCKLENEKEVHIVEGVIVKEQPEDDICNLIYQYGKPKLVYLDKMEFIRYKPPIGHVRDSLAFPIEQRITFIRRDRTRYVERPRDFGRYSFCHARCVRGIEDNEDYCFIDLLNVTVKLSEKIKDKVPPGVAFVANLDYEIKEEQSSSGDEMVHKIYFTVKAFVNFTLEDIPFQRCKWGMRDMNGFLPEQLPFDYTRKFEPLAPDYHFIIYIGDETFISNKHGKQYVHKGLHHCNLNLTVGKIYGAHVVPSRLERGPTLYTIAIFEVNNQTYKNKDLDPYRTIEELELLASRECGRFTYSNRNNRALV